MKNKIILISLVFAAFLASCSFFERSPKETVDKFYKTLEKSDFKAMAEVATPETVELMAIFGTKIQGMMAAKNRKVKTVTEKIDGETAVVTITFDDEEKEIIDLKRIDGKWKVHISMDSGKGK
jgi:hypothetical protein